MKKKIVLVGVIASMGLGAFLASCDDAASKGCDCSIAGIYSISYTPEVMQEAGIKTCKELQNFLSEESGYLGMDVSCKIH